MPETQLEARRSLMLKAVQNGKYFYNYSEYLLAISLRALCCCCTKLWPKMITKKLERHEIAREKFANEIDIVQLLYVQRIARFMAKLTLKKH